MATSSLLGKRKYCSHCKENVSLATYRRHREQASSQGLKLMEADDEEVQDSLGLHEQDLLSQHEQDLPPFDDNESTHFLVEENDSSNEAADTDCSSEFHYEEEDDTVMFDSESEDEEVEIAPPTILSPITRSVLLFLLMWQFLFNIPDAALSAIIVFLYHLLKSITAISGNNVISKWTETFPLSLNLVHREILGNHIKFTEYVVCSKCHSLYDSDKCVITSGSSKSSRKCEYIEFPDHPQRNFRQICGTVLLRTVKNKSTVAFKPFKIYCYQSVQHAASRLLKRPGFSDMCELWKERSFGSNYLGDIYDGRVWTDLRPFLAVKHSWCVALNVDWFQPFTHISDSVGVLYLVILNLPRQERYKKENMILTGIIPGPSEPSLNINSYLAPLVMELKQLYDGVLMQSILKNGKCVDITLRVALVAAMCDLPASRKVCGFCSFNSLHGCNKCLKEFPTEAFGESPDYSGYNVASWSARDIAVHRQKGYEHFNAKTKSQQKIIEKNYGIRYSILLDLPYFDPIRYTLIDPMHNLFLGTAKHCLELWVKKDIITRKDFLKMEEQMLHLHAPHSAGRLPLKIGSGFAGFTADQWRNWTIGYSPIVLRQVLPREHLQYWLLFVKGCSILCSRCLLKEHVELAHNYLHMFCCQFLQVNGPNACTPNMHLHMHLKECLYDYGPPYAFWCYAFERYNGMLGSFPTNKRSIERQLMRKCLILQELHSQPFPEEGQCFKSLLMQHAPLNGGGILMSMKEEDIHGLEKLSAPHLNEYLDFTVIDRVKCLPPVKLIVLNSDQVASLQTTYKLLYPKKEFNTWQRFAKQSSRISISEEVFGSRVASRDSNIVVNAYWPSNSTMINTNRCFTLSIGEIQYFVKHFVSFVDEQGTKEHLFAYVHWFKRHENFDWFGSSAMVCSPFKEEDESYSFIPVQRIISLCIHGTIRISFTNQQQSETVLVAVPLHKKHVF